MKQINKLLPYVLIMLSVYLVLSFIPFEFNPARWSEDTRLGFVGLCFVIFSLRYLWELFKD